MVPIIPKRTIRERKVITGCFIIFLLLAPSALFSQTGSIRGQVTDARTGEVLVGANVIIVGSKPGRGAASDMNGMYVIYKLTPGEYTVQATYLEYLTITMHDVKVLAGQTTETNFAMRREGDSEPVAKEAPDTLVVQRDSTKQKAPEQ